VRRSSIRIVAAAAAVAAVATASVAANSTHAASAVAINEPLRVASTLDGRSVLPHRITWSGSTSLPASKVKRVDFLIDGKLDWTEHSIPYTFADDRGFLVTSWLTPGIHVFTVRVTAVDGRRADDTVRARVLLPAAVPAALAGTWQRRIADTSGAPVAGSVQNPTDTLTPPGTYRITFDRRWIHDEFPCTNSPCTYNSNTGAGGEFNTDWIPGPTRFSVLGGVTIHTFKDTDRLAGWWCETWGPAATYTWTVSGNTLTLAPVGGNDACGIRGFVWAGRWTKVA
jgi:hypothetical protein